MADISLLLEDLYFAEALRWHDGRLWFSDFYDHAVHATTLDGVDERVVEIPEQPSGLGWLRDGRLVIVSMRDLQLLAFDGTDVAAYADLAGVATCLANDLVVDGDGRCYVTNFGFDLDALLDAEGPAALFADPGPPTGALAAVAPDGTVSVAAEGLGFGNGMVITPDGGTLIVAETLAQQLTAFDRALDGTLSNRRVFADVAGRAPDGICLDAEGCVWIANAIAPECVRVAEGGAVLDRVETISPSFCCALGGPGSTTLFIATAITSHHAIASTQRSGRIVTAEVAVPAAGAA